MAWPGRYSMALRGRTRGAMVVPASFHTSPDRLPPKKRLTARRSRRLRRCSQHADFRRKPMLTRPLISAALAALLLAPPASAGLGDAIKKAGKKATDAVEGSKPATPAAP